METGVGERLCEADCVLKKKDSRKPWILNPSLVIFRPRAKNDQHKEEKYHAAADERHILSNSYSIVILNEVKHDITSIVYNSLQIC